jgi:DNA-binding transcriptional regulator YiaG
MTTTKKRSPSSRKETSSVGLTQVAPSVPLARAVREGFGISRKLFSRLTGYSERALADWEAGKSLSEPSRQRLIEMQRLQNALARVMRAEFISEWLLTPNESFGNLKPLEVIERGEVDRIWRMIYQLEAGIPE